MYSRLFCVLSACLLIFASCKNKTAGNHLPPKLMEKVLLDISIAESYSTMVKDSLHAAGTKNYDSLSVYYKDVLNHYKITKEQLTESLNWYKNHPTELDSMYANILAAATRLQSKAGSKP